MIGRSRLSRLRSACDRDSSWHIVIFQKSILTSAVCKKRANIESWRINFSQNRHPNLKSTNLENRLKGLGLFPIPILTATSETLVLQSRPWRAPQKIQLGTR